MNIKEFFGKHINRRRLKYGSFATALTVLFIAAIVLINIVATMLFDRFPITLDLTSGSIYTISDETAEYIEGITEPVAMTVLATEDEYRSISSYTAQCTELLKNYTQHNSGISLRFVDMLSNPDFVASYSQDLANGDIIIELDDGTHSRVKVVTLTDIIVVPEDYSYYLSNTYVSNYGADYIHSMLSTYGLIQSSNAEQAITSAIMTVTDANPVTAAVLSYPGGNESDVSGLTDLLDANGYILENLDVSADELTEDVDLVIIPAPKIDYSSEEISKLETWIANGGHLGKNVIYVASAEQQRTPNLDALLYKYGITVEYKMIHETSTSRYTNLDTYTYQDIVTENYTDGMTSLARPFVVPDARAVTARFENVDSTYSCETLVASSSSAVLKDMFDDGDDWTPENATERGSFATAVIGKQEKINQDTHISDFTYVVAFGSDLMLNSVFMGTSSFNNGDFIISMVNDITGKSEGITITPKVVDTGTFDITEAQTRTLTLVFAVIIPVVVIAVGTFVWIRRRHK